MENKIQVKYVVYEMNVLAGSSKFMCLQEVNFDGWQLNAFDTEKEAIDALVEDNKMYNHYLIIKRIYITQ